MNEQTVNKQPIAGRPLPASRAPVSLSLCCAASSFGKLRLPPWGLCYVGFSFKECSLFISHGFLPTFRS